MAELEYLYHYTAPLRWEQIEKSGYLKLTPSNLKKLVNPHLITLDDGTKAYVDETDDYKPVVWLTSSDTPNNHGLNGPKEKIQIAIKYDKSKHHWWWTWKEKNRADKKMTNSLISNGAKYATWYICEEIIPLEEILWVKNLDTGKIIFGSIEN